MFNKKPTANVLTLDTTIVQEFADDDLFQSFKMLHPELQKQVLDQAASTINGFITASMMRASINKAISEMIR